MTDCWNQFEVPQGQIYDKRDSTVSNVVYANAQHPSTTSDDSSAVLRAGLGAGIGAGLPLLLALLVSLFFLRKSRIELAKAKSSDTTIPYLPGSPKQQSDFRVQASLRELSPHQMRPLRELSPQRTHSVADTYYERTEDRSISATPETGVSRPPHELDGSYQ